MLIYTCNMCSLTEDAELVPEDKRLIAPLLHIIWPYKGLGELTTYLCKDCYKSILRHIKEQREYFSAMQERDKKLEQDSREGYQEDHDCRTLTGDGCQVCEDRDNAA